ncbi:MAG: hypothetical protein E7262_03270 [Lachnospiraceae bacterium]|nr:hypothetical protein [Lachnospiraceae bacterium]
MKKVILLMIVGIMLLAIIYISRDDVSNVKTDEYVAENEEDVKEYMLNLVQKDWDYEMIKTMCVLVRTGCIYGKVNEVEENIKQYYKSIYNNIHSNNITFKKLPSKIQTKIKKAIDKGIEETKGEIIVYKKDVVYPFFHYVSPRVTRNEDSNLKINIPYLKKRICKYDIESKEFIQIKYFNKADVIKKIASDTEGKEISISKVDKSGYVYGLKIDNKYNVDVNKFIYALGLNSNNFTISTYTENKDIIRIVCRGKGSGMGLSIYDANRLAKKENRTYKEIIKLYFKKIEIKKYVV